MPDQLSLPESFTERELDVLRLMADGLTNREIAAKLVVEPETVRGYTKQIYGKLGVHSRTQAGLRAKALNLPAAGGTGFARPPIAARRSNLPVYTTSFVGREQELNDLQGLLADPQARLITIVGPGGIGKTRLGVEAAQSQVSHYADGVFFIPLASLSSMDEVVPLMAREIELRLKADDDPQTQLLTHLRDKQMLLVLDNCEHFLIMSEREIKRWTGLLAEILETAPAVKLLTTSQLPLDLGWEWTHYLDGIPFPGQNDAAQAEDYDAVKLFLDRVRRGRRDFNLAAQRDCVLDICRLVYGMPLAIELAAVWSKTLSCADVLEAIRRNIDFLATTQRDADQRQRSIRAVFDYSWRLLTAEEQRVFQRLSVFRGGFGLAAADQVAGASAQMLGTLIDKSFIYQNSAGLYEIHDLWRRYAEEQLNRQMTAGDLSRRSRLLLAWSWLIKGDFEKAERLAATVLGSHTTVTTPDEEAFSLALLGLLAGLDEDYDRCRQLCAASLPFTRRAPDSHQPIISILARLGLAMAYCGLEDYAAVKRAIRAALETAANIRSPALLTLCLPMAAIVLAHEVETERAIELLALAFTHSASTPAWLEKWPLLMSLRVELELELGPKAFRAVWADGQKLDLETVVADLRDDLLA